jgi:hypothetical protein
MMTNCRYPTLGVERITPHLPLLHDFVLSDAKYVDWPVRFAYVHDNDH